MAIKNQHCSFCGKSKEETKRLITGPDGVCICDECVEICKSMVDEWAGEKVETEEYKKNMDPRQFDYIASDIVITKLFNFLKANNEMYKED